MIELIFYEFTGNQKEFIPNNRCVFLNESEMLVKHKSDGTSVALIIKDNYLYTKIGDKLVGKILPDFPIDVEDKYTTK